MTAPRVSLDPLRYGVRALGEVSRAEASVAVPPPPEGDTFAPRRVVPYAPRDGVALSLRLFTDGADDATRFVLRDAPALSLAPAPARAATFFEAHVGALAWDGDEDPVVVVGLPLVTFFAQGALRAAPLFSWSGVRVAWTLGGAPWSLAPGLRVGDPLDAPDALVLDATDAEGTPRFALHAGLWSALFDVDGELLSALSRVGGDDPARLVRAAVRALQEDALDDPPLAEGPLTRADLVALCDAVIARAPPRREVKAHPHGLAMLLPRGDPTAGLRAELDALLREPAPREGALAVFLGAEGKAAPEGELWARGPSPPTASQLAAARAFEATRDLVAVRGPPGCGKTTLLHHVAAQAVVARALDGAWRRPPPRDVVPWALVVASTNNAAVDHALAPFVASRALPVGLRLGNRRVLAEHTAPTLAAALAALEVRPALSHGEALRAFDDAVAPVRSYLGARSARSAEEAARATKAEARTKRMKKLRAKLGRPFVAPADGAPSPDALDTLRGLLTEHRDAIVRVGPMYLEGPRPDPDKARARWDEANRHRGAQIAPGLLRLGLAVPFGALAGDDVAVAIEHQRAAMEVALDALARIANGLRRERWQRELDDLIAEEAVEPAPALSPPAPDASLPELALAARDAWAWEHRRSLLPRLLAAHGRLTAAPGPERRTPTTELLLALSPLFPVVGCTLLSTRASFPLDEGVIDRLVVDEAGQCAPVYAIPALARAKRAMLTGDVAQLPPVYTLDERLDERLARGLSLPAVAPFRMGTSRDTSAQRVGEARATTRLSLVEHFRSQPAIVALASAWSGYALDVRTPPRSLAAVCPWLARPVLAVPVRGAGERTPGGVVNEAEARKVVALVVALRGDGVASGDLAVLTPFVGQSARIERGLAARGITDVPVRTVHKLQGGERRVVIFSLTATTRMHLRWVAERPHLLHVATSRAQDHLVVIFDPERARTEPNLAPLVALADGGREA